jgi:hypothetical protein
MERPILRATYYSHGIATPRPPFVRRRRRRGTLERPINARLYRGAWLIAAVPLLIAAFTVAHPNPLPKPQLPPSFSLSAALRTTSDLAGNYPDRRPGTPGDVGATQWLVSQLNELGFQTHTDTFTATIPGRGRVRLQNVSAVAVAPTSSPDTLVVMAHRDNTGLGPGVNDNASGTAALLELARTYSRPAGASGQPVSPAHTILFLSTDGGAFGGIGAEHFVTHSPYRSRIVAVVNLDALAGGGPARLEIAGDQARSPAAALVSTAAQRISEQTGVPPGRTSAVGQLIDLGFPFSLYEQAPFVGHGIPAVTLTTGGDRPPPAFADRLQQIDTTRFGELGRAAQSLLASLDGGLELTQGTSSYVYLGSRLVRGWAIQLSLFAILLPYLVAVVDLFARCRRRRIRLAPALRSYRSRLAFWLWAGVLFGLFGLLGAWPSGTARPVNPATSAAGHWPRAALIGLGVVLLVSWLVPRERLRRRRPVTAEEDLAGHAAALLALGVLSLVIVAINPFALVFVLPTLHIWLWLPQVREQQPWVRAAVLLAGFAGPLILLGSFADRFGLGLDAPWYLAELVAIGYVPIVAVVIALAWTAGAAQLIAVTTGRYAPYPRLSERPPRGPLRNTVRAIVLTSRSMKRRGRPMSVEDVQEI